MIFSYIYICDNEDNKHDAPFHYDEFIEPFFNPVSMTIEAVTVVTTHAPCNRSIVMYVIRDTCP